MASSPLAPFLGGTLPASVINNLTNYVNTLFAGLGQTATAVASSNLTLTTSNVDIPSAQITVAATGTSAILLVYGAVGWICSVGSAGSYFVGDLLVDGVNQNASGSILTHADSTFNQQTDSRVWSTPVTLGSHVVKLQARKSSAGPTGQSTTGSTLTVVLLDMP